MSLKDVYNDLLKKAVDCDISSGMNEQILFSDIISPNSKVYLDAGFRMGLKLSLDKKSIEEILDKFEEKWSEADPKYKKSLQFLTHSVSSVVNEFLGQSGTSANRTNTYLKSGDESISLSDIKGKNIGLCVERAAIAHQVFTVLSESGISNYKSIYTTSELEVDDGTNNYGPHAFIILENKTKESERYIYDIQNPIVVKKDDEQYRVDGIFDLSEDEYESYINKDMISPKCTYENYGYELVSQNRKYGLKFGNLLKPNI